MPKHLAHIAALAFAALAAAAGCSKPASTTAPATVAVPAPCASARAPAVRDGCLIFQTGRDVDGKQIVASKHPLFPKCAACHHADGSGGRHLPGGAISADLRHKALVTDQKHPYTLALLKRAISTGIDNEGKPLAPAMPHWKLTQRDLHDVAAYVLSLK